MRAQFKGNSIYRHSRSKINWTLSVVGFAHKKVHSDRIAKTLLVSPSKLNIQSFQRPHHIKRVLFLSRNLFSWSVFNVLALRIHVVRYNMFNWSSPCHCWESLDKYVRWKLLDFLLDNELYFAIIHRIAMEPLRTIFRNRSHWKVPFRLAFEFRHVACVKTSREMIK